MAWSLRKRTVEYVIYILFWGVLLLSPLLGAFMKYAIQGDDAFLPTTEELLSFWKFLLPAIILFFINNNILNGLFNSFKLKIHFKPILLFKDHLCIDESIISQNFYFGHRNFNVQTNRFHGSKQRHHQNHR